ncbi:PREDICTED: uncharacterized protein LOC104701831 [Camelina sativa]|uniref:Uncharacterized protein LOC104701831 n=1 Tax=Camelina sativa TaxID=90675 RepID=A0ABM0STF8_CAMSA|nr:PREDICTED: uncharacterized protein LOC104701831 [Camelina sativa]
MMQPEVVLNKNLTNCPTYLRRRPTRNSEKPNRRIHIRRYLTMRLHSAITLRNFFTRKPLRIPQNLSIISSPVTINSLADVSGPSPSHYSKSSLSEASSTSSRIFRIPNASFSKSFLENQRSFSTDSSSGGGSPPDLNKVVDEINLKFAEAREEIEMAMDSKETVYFNEEAECARAAVTEVLEMFEGLLRKVTEKEKASLQRSMGLKIEQLKAELQQLNE